jgi:RHS repeat-associated protein
MHFENSSKLQAQQYTHASHYSYDIAGNVYTMIQDYPNGVINDKVLVYDCDLQSGKVNSLTYQPGKADQFIHRYGYDAANRLIKVSTGTNGLFWDTDAEYFYYRHGPLARLELGSDKVQGLDYFYTLQGYIKGVNGTSFNPETDMGRDGIIAPAAQGGTQPAVGTITLHGQTIQLSNLNMIYGSSFNGPGYGTMHSAMARDAFAYVLEYFEDDYKPQSPNTFLDDLNQTSGQVKYLYNGNIARMYTQLQELGNTGFNYRYDQLNRLISQDGWKLDNGAMLSLGQAYSVNLSYDPDGNILTLKRNGHAGNIDMDDLSYRYYAADGSTFKPTTGSIPKNATNRLAGVSDNVSPGNYPETPLPAFGTVTDIDDQSTNGNYTYDLIGNLISDAAEGITNIEWNLQNKVSHITKNDGTTISFEYDALGNRVMKAVKNTIKDEKTWYVRDAQGNTLTVYTKNELAPADEKGLHWVEAHLYGSSRLGLYKPDMPMPPETTDPTISPMMYPSAFYEPANFQLVPGTTTQGTLTLQTPTPITQPATGTNYKTTRGHKQYELTNHLGNVLATISDRKLPAKDKDGILFYTADLISAQDYYPFGSPMPGRNYSSGDYRYGFNGMEEDNEVKGDGNSYDFGARIYDPRVGRWLSLDPLQTRYPALSPYNYVANSPIQFIDPDGQVINRANSKRLKEVKRALIKTPTGRAIWKGARKAPGRVAFVLTDNVLVKPNEGNGGGFSITEGITGQSEEVVGGVANRTAKTATVKISLGTMALKNAVANRGRVANYEDLSREDRNTYIQEELATGNYNVQNARDDAMLDNDEFSSVGVATTDPYAGTAVEQVRKDPLPGETRGEFVNRLGVHEGHHFLTDKRPQNKTDIQKETDAYKREATNQAGQMDRRKNGKTSQDPNYSGRGKK